MSSRIRLSPQRILQSCQHMHVPASTSFSMRFAVISSALLACGLGVFAAPSAARLSKPSNPGLESAGAPETPPLLKYAFTAKIDWDLNNVSNGLLLHSDPIPLNTIFHRTIQSILRRGDVPAFGAASTFTLSSPFGLNSI